MTLVEILVALTISLILIGGVIQIFIGNKLTYRVQDSLSRIQENGRYAVELLNQDIRMANYRGCAGPKPTTARNLLNSSTDIRWNFLNAIPVNGFDNTTISSAWPADLGNIGLSNTGTSNTSVVGGTDVLTVRGPDTTNSAFITAQTNTNGPLQVNQPTSLSLQTNDVVMVADCTDIVVFQIANTTLTPFTIALTGSGSTLTPGNANTNLNKFFIGAEVTRLSAKTYYIATGANGQPALFRRVAGVSQELVEGVENLQLVFGVDDAGACGGIGSSNDGAIDCYLSAENINATIWPVVRSLQVRLLLRSLENNLTPTPQEVAYNGGTVNTGSGADRRLRQVFTSTVGLRNQLR
ncbi:MAG: PilW family protein [Candidatus Competibacteraceae bacterium]|nr:PilW family protein [Candidatus Competibacteraceae bacterium]